MTLLVDGRAVEVSPGATVLDAIAESFLTNRAFDPSSRIPEYKVCAVTVERT